MRSKHWMLYIISQTTSFLLSVINSLFARNIVCWLSLTLSPALNICFPLLPNTKGQMQHSKTATRRSTAAIAQHEPARLYDFYVAYQHIAVRIECYALHLSCWMTDWTDWMLRWVRIRLKWIARLGAFWFLVFTFQSACGSAFGVCNCERCRLRSCTQP